MPKVVLTLSTDARQAAAFIDAYGQFNGDEGLHIVVRIRMFGIAKK